MKEILCLSSTCTVYMLTNFNTFTEYWPKIA